MFFYSISLKMKEMYYSMYSTAKPSILFFVCLCLFNSSMTSRTKAYQPTVVLIQEHNASNTVINTKPTNNQDTNLIIYYWAGNSESPAFDDDFEHGTETILG